MTLSLSEIMMLGTNLVGLAATGAGVYWKVQNLSKDVTELKKVVSNGLSSNVAELHDWMLQEKARQDERDKLKRSH